MEDAFPVVEPKIRPFGSRILVQVRCAKMFSDGGIQLHPDAVDTEKWNTQVAKVITLGPGAFRNRETLILWPEGQWCQEGDFVRIPKYAGDRWEVNFGKENDKKALFIVFEDMDIVGSIEGAHVLDIVAYL